MIIEVTHLGLAAYIKMSQAQLVRVEGKSFFFETNRSLNDWRVAYNNSCCIRHDAVVCELRDFIRRA